MAAAGSFDGPFGMIAAMIMARANRAAEAKAVAELAPFPKTGLRSHRHRQPHGPGARWASRNAMKPRIQCVLTPWNPGFTASTSGNLLPIEETSRLLIGYRDRMAARAESFRQAKERFSRSLSGPYRASVFFELLSLDHLIAMTGLEVAGTDKALAALRRFGSDGALASAEQASDLLDAIRDVS